MRKILASTPLEVFQVDFVYNCFKKNNFQMFFQVQGKTKVLN